MSKQYGLIIPGKQKTVEPPKSDFTKPSIFGESSDSDDDNAPPQLKMKPTPYTIGASEKRIAKKLQEKALEEDPTVFQYDELYDELENKRDEEKKAKSSEVKKPKYIGRLLQYAEKRKLENERRIERMVQKERDQEGEQFKDKESFVTSTYRKKLEEMQRAEDDEKREDYLEAIGDVTKQKDLDGFYRHLYEQKLGTRETKTTEEKENSSEQAKTSQEEESTGYKPIKSGKPRAYRKRRTSDDEEEESAGIEPSKRAHIQSNLDADSDFSIDSSSDEDESDKKKQSHAVDIKKEPVEEEIDPKTKEAASEDKSKTLEKIKEEKSEEKEEQQEPKIDKSLIWKKRTVGDVFDAALQRYFQRKANRG